MSDETPHRGPSGPPPEPVSHPPGRVNGHTVPAQAGAPGGVRPPALPAPRPADHDWQLTARSVSEPEPNPARRAAWLGLAAAVILCGMAVGAKSCARAIGGGDLAALRAEPIAAAPPSGTELHRAASFGGGGSPPWIERIYAVPADPPPLDWYTATFAERYGLAPGPGLGDLTRTGSRVEGRRSIRVRVDIRDVASGPRFVDRERPALAAAPAGTASYVTVVLSTTRTP